MLFHRDNVDIVDGTQTHINIQKIINQSHRHRIQKPKMLQQHSDLHISS